MTTHALVVDLCDADALAPALVGPKAARLALLIQNGYDVPSAFVVTLPAYRAGLDDEVRAAIEVAYRGLVSSGAALVAVRSSAASEDTETASYAGMQETVLGVATYPALLEAVERVWSSYRAVHAEEYRRRSQGSDSGIAVIVQRQLAATVAGVAFARDPMTGAHVTLIEAVSGLGDALMSGHAEPQRWRVRNDGARWLPENGARGPVLDDEQVKEICTVVERLGALFGAPQDVEWTYEGDVLWVLQSRPITTIAEDWFTTRLSHDDQMWGAAFLNERFTLPVSPLGWTMVAGPLETLALRGPLALLGATVQPPLLKLWQGHPYSRVEAWQKIYKLFPGWLLPDDAARFFPDGDASLRGAPREPVYGPHLLVNAVRALAANWDATAPWRNPAGWARYERKQTAALIRLDFLARRLPDEEDLPAAARAILRESAGLTDELLEYHRWSLLYADLFYSLLRRWLAARHGAEEGARRLSSLTTRVDSPTTEMNRALNRLVMQAASLRAELEAVAAGAPLPTGGSFWEGVRRFLDLFGHRFMSLDIYDPPWEADHPSFARLLLSLTPVTEPPAAARTYTPLIRLTRAYLRLREAQRFAWQQVMALQRRVIVQVGRYSAERGNLSAEGDVFGLTWEEILSGRPDAVVAAGRVARLEALRREAAIDLAWHYPEFLRGTEPVIRLQSDSTLRGRPVSPGIVRGRARLVRSPADFARITPGDILVTQAPDPGWTPIFGTVAGMVTERGGQLSHGAVIAREYRLPTVSGISGLLGTVQEGEWLLIDGTKGLVLRGG